MPLDISNHRNILLQILKDIYSDTTISSFLGFKGGTAAFMFYGLNRFSVDLDFDLLDKSKEEYILKRIEVIAKKYGVVKEARIKRFNLLCVISYAKKAQNIKVEINRKGSGSKYQIKTYLGISMLIMCEDDMFAHKLMAMNDRIGKTSRDVYDVWFFLKHNWPINKKIIEERSGKPFVKFLQESIRKIEKMNSRNILNGIGELLTQSQKDWVKAKLIEDTLFLLKLKLENESSE